MAPHRLLELKRPCSCMVVSVQKKKKTCCKMTSSVAGVANTQTVFCFWCQINPSHAIAQTPCIYCTQKSPYLHDGMCFN